MPVDGGLNDPALTAEVRYTRPRHTIGDDQPRPGIAVVHATLSVVDQRSGSADRSATPRPPGPRNCGQSTDSAARGCDMKMETTRSRTPRQQRRVVIPSKSVA